jgi:dihydrofolate synthase/folylpolyglutamate synthase
MNYQQTVEYLFTRLPLFSRIGAAAYKADLSNTIELCKSLDNPQDKIKCIHIAGTNGKGSTSHMLAAILQAAGYKTGLYTSPHLKDFRERIKIDGEMISEDFVVGFTERIRPQIDKIEPSFFEITVAMAFDYFQQEQVDIAVIETGLGGRLDSTNIIHPELSVITNIGFDHMNLLGDTLEKIAAEKAGIIKKQVPVVIGETLPATKKIFEQKALEMEAPICYASSRRQVQNWEWKNNHLWIEVSEERHTDHKVYELDLPGLYQQKNLLTVLEACSQLKHLGWKLEDRYILQGLKETRKNTGLHGRWETIHANPQVILDVAHNTDGIRQLVQQAEIVEKGQLHIVLGMVKDKDVEQVLNLLPIQAVYYFTKASIPRALPEDELREKAKEKGLNGHSFPNVNKALQTALDHAHSADLILVCGSVFVVGEVDKSVLKGNFF